MKKIIFTEFYSNTLEYGLRIQEKNHRVIPHTHDFIEIIYQINGQSYQIIDQKQIQLFPGEFIILNTDQIHENPIINSDVINILISPKLLSNMIVESSFDSSVVKLKDLFLNYTHEAKYTIDHQSQGILQTLIFNFLNKQEFDYLLQRTYLIQFLLSIYKNTKFEIVMHSNRKSDLFMYIHNNLKTASLNEYSKLMCLSPSATSIKIKKYYNLTFLEILQDFRLTKAMQLLITTDSNIETIASEIGYENHSYFYKLFKAKYGMTPKQYRNVCDKKL